MPILASVWSILVMVFGFGVLIFVHELGHFLAAKWAGIRAEAFAIGMGPVAVSWRKGIGLRFGSTLPAYERRVREHLAAEGAAGDRELTVSSIYRTGDAIGLGETEYSLRWLPIGGFVKMLGQEDANPAAYSDDPRSYNMCPVGKRMIVVSAGVVMNVLLAILLFVIAFLAGVRFEAPVIGDVAATLPAGTAQALNAAELGIEEVGLQPGDVVLTIDGKPARTFNDLQIASAMGRPGLPISITVQRTDVPEPLRFELEPTMDRTTELLSIGVFPGRSTTLFGGDDAAEVNAYLEEAGLAAQGVEAGMTLVSVDGHPITTRGELARMTDERAGAPLATIWVDAAGRAVEATFKPTPRFQQLVQPSPMDGGRVAEYGLLGFCPPTIIRDVLDDSSNAGLLRAGDVVVQAAEQAWPRWSQFQAIVARHAGQSVRVVVRRDGQEIPVDAQVNRRGLLGVSIASDEQQPVTTDPVDAVIGRDATDATVLPTAAATVNLMPGTRFNRVAGVAVDDWADMRAALRDATADALAAGAGARVAITVTHPTPGADTETLELVLSSDEVRALAQLGWDSLDPALFEPIYTTLSADGNPVRAMVMGFTETHKMIVMTYLTIDRLFRGTVGVEQLRGPIGIVDIGARILPKGFMYFVFFLGMISVNLAVINFLPLPIVDGGLFLFLVYEKLKGRPPSLRFQHAATIVGLCLLGAIFVVTFYNDIARLVS